MEPLERFGWRWSDLTEDECRIFERLLQSVGDSRFSECRVVRGSRAKVPFYRNHRLTDLRLEQAVGLTRCFLLDSGEDPRFYWLDGDSGSIHSANEVEHLQLTEATVIDYVRFFFYFVRATEGAFVLLESPDDVAPGEASGEVVTRLRGYVHPVRLAGSQGEMRFKLEAVVAYAGGVFRTDIAVAANGTIEMTDDDPLELLQGAVVPTYAALEAAPAAPKELAAGQAAAPEDAPKPKGEAEQAAGIEGEGGRRLVPTSDRETTAAFLRVLLNHAVRRQLGHRLLQRFNVEAEAAEPIDQLRRFVTQFSAIVAIESDISFVEDMVRELLDPREQTFPAHSVSRASRASGEDGTYAVDASSANARLYLISMHACQRLIDIEWTAYALSMSSATVLIGAPRFADVPEPLRCVVELVLTIPRIDETLFPMVFAAVFGEMPPADWKDLGREWPKYLLHTDFHAPVRLKLTAPEALAYLHEQCRARLEYVSPLNTPSLADLAGLGEARDVAEDLIADIAQALARRIPWSAVDRGLLLVGPPGTGKTTLARAIAKECGIKFIQASAMQWQSAGSLSDHLRAMRTSFAEARRYSPSILFIDEIDSIGSRELLQGSNAVYQTDVINALLEQLQGLDPAEPIIVLAATNYAEKVDPALRRAGRLDQIVQVPLPNVPGLAQIFAFYLKPYRDTNEVSPDVADTLAAQLAFGSTGADVEFFVRGAARRARREGRAISQADLTAEIMRQPTRPRTLTRFTPEQIRRTAVHEAGHAISLILSKADPQSLTYVSIVPTLDGALGFTAHAPEEDRSLTRLGALERLRTMLAGRAAEELVYGPEQVGSGAGGSESSDLAQATSLATWIVCRSGLDGIASLRWSQQPTPPQLRQVDRLLREAHREALQVLAQWRSNFDKVVEGLLLKQQVSAAELRDLFYREPPKSPRAETGPRRRRR